MKQIGNNKTQITKSQSLPSVLKTMETQLVITKNILAIHERQRIINIAIKIPNVFVNMLSKFYPLSPQLIEKYKNKWDWEKLSDNESLPWNDALIEKYKDKWNWWKLSDNKSLPWSKELLDKFSHLWNWYSMDFGEEEHGLSCNSALPWSEELLDKFKDKWEWGDRNWRMYGIRVAGLSGNHFLPLTNELLEKYEDKWVWDFLIYNPLLPWTWYLYSRYFSYVELSSYNRLNDIAENESFPWTIEDVEECITSDEFEFYGIDIEPFSILPVNLPSISTDFIEKYEKLWDWNYLSIRRNICWTIEFIEKYEDKLNFKYMSNNTSIPWSVDLLKKYEDKWDWWELSANSSLPWTEKLIHIFEKRWNWSGLSANSSLPWSVELLECYLDKWGWSSLIANDHFPWSMELIEKYIDKIGFNQYSQDVFAPYEKIFKPYLTDDFIDEIMQKITEKQQ